MEVTETLLDTSRSIKNKIVYTNSNSWDLEQRLVQGISTPQCAGSFFLSCALVS